MWHYASCATESYEMDGHMTGEYATKMMHEPFFSDLVSTHNQTCDCVSPMSMNNLKSKYMSPTILHDDHTS